MPKTMEELNAELRRVFTSDDWLRENKDVVIAGLALFEKDLAARLSELDEDDPKVTERCRVIMRALRDTEGARKALEAMGWPEKGA